MVVILANLFNGDVVYAQNLGGIDPEKPYRATLKGVVLRRWFKRNRQKKFSLLNATINTIHYVKEFKT